MMTDTPNLRNVNFNVREDTNDAALAIAILNADEYLLRNHAPLTGWALDIGAHIGTVAVAMAIDNPDIRVIAVEPVPDNAALVRENIAANGLGDRVFVEEAAAGAIGQSTARCAFGYRTGGTDDLGYIEQNRFIGNIWRNADWDAEVIEAPVLTLRGLAEKYGTEEFTYCKIDCEGCEWDFLVEDAQLIREIVGEYHDSGPERIVLLLEETHDVTIISDHNGTGIFRAVRR